MTEAGEGCVGDAEDDGGGGTAPTSRCIMGMTTGSTAACRSTLPPRISLGEGENEGEGSLMTSYCTHQGPPLVIRCFPLRKIP